VEENARNACNPLSKAHPEQDVWLEMALTATMSWLWQWDLATDTFQRQGWLANLLKDYPEEYQRNFRMETHTEDRQMVEEAMERALENGEDFQAQFRAILPKEGMRWIASKAKVIRDEQGKAVRVLGISTDITARKQAEDALQTSQRLFHTFVENHPACIFLKDADGKFLFANRNMARCLGTELEDVLGKTLFQILPEADAQRFTAHDAAVLTSGVPDSRIESSHLKGITRNWFIIRFPITDLPGGPLVGGVALDITEQIEAQTALRETEARLNAILATLPDIVWSIDADTQRTLYASPATEAIYGRPVQDFFDNPDLWLNMIVEEDKKRLPRFFEEVNKIGRAEVEYRIMRPDGDERWIHDAAHLVCDPNGNPLRYDGIARDITEQKRAERELRRANRRTVNILESITDGFVMLDRDWRITYLNPRMEQLLGLSRAALLGNQLWDFLPEKENEAVAQALQRSLARQTPVSLEEFFPALNLWLQINAHPSQSGMSIYVQDISERKRIENQMHAQLVSQKRNAEGVVRVVSRTLEIRNPYSAAHHRNTSHLVRALAGRMQMPSDRIENLQLAALLHDVGKITLPTEILMMPRKLTDLEFRLIQTHTQVGYDILNDADFPPEVALVALQHHERLDGSGYPNRLRGREILLEARIMAVADVLDAMLTDRPHRNALPMEHALRELLDHKGVRYDADAVDACMTLCTEYDFDYAEMRKRLAEG
jgi:PAS domain S-box-containing protein